MEKSISKTFQELTIQERLSFYPKNYEFDLFAKAELHRAMMTLLDRNLQSKDKLAIIKDCLEHIDAEFEAKSKATNINYQNKNK